MAKGLGIALWIVLAASYAAAQLSERKIEPYPCEFNPATLNAAHQVAEEKDLIIFIARLGDGESRRELNRRRLHNVRTYLTSELYWKRDLKTVIVAEGERVKGYGRVEIYIKGILMDVIAAKRDRHILVGSCEPDEIRPKWADEIFYPFLDEKLRKSKRRVER